MEAVDILQVLYALQAHIVSKFTVYSYEFANGERYDLIALLCKLITLNC